VRRFEAALGQDWAVRMHELLYESAPPAPAAAPGAAANDRGGEGKAVPDATPAEQECTEQEAAASPPQQQHQLQEEEEEEGNEEEDAAGAPQQQQQQQQQPSGTGATTSLQAPPAAACSSSSHEPSGAPAARVSGTTHALLELGGQAGSSCASPPPLAGLPLGPGPAEGQGPDGHAQDPAVESTSARAAAPSEGAGPAEPPGSSTPGSSAPQGETSSGGSQGPGAAMSRPRSPDLDTAPAGPPAAPPGQAAAARQVDGAGTAAVADAGAAVRALQAFLLITGLGQQATLAALPAAEQGAAPLILSPTEQCVQLPSGRWLKLQLTEMSDR
jgi:hypothetical protein